MPFQKRSKVLSSPCLLYNRFLSRSRFRSTSHIRGFATPKKSPSFNTSAQASPEELLKNAKSKYKINDGPQEPPKDSPEPKSRLQRWGITPGRVILIAIFSYTGYRLSNWRTDPQRSLILNGKNFTPFILESKDHLSSSSSIFNLLSVPAGQNTYNVTEAWKLGVWSVQVMQPELHIARSYTPLPPNDNSPAEQIRLAVRKEPEGEVSGFLHRIPLGTIVHLRGPHPEYVIPNDIDEILFLAGGTGISPAMQVIHSLFSARNIPAERKPKIRILWANRRSEDSYAGPKTVSVEDMRASILSRVRKSLTGGASVSTDVIDQQSKTRVPVEADAGQDQPHQTTLVRELEILREKHTGHLNVEYFVDEEGKFITEKLLRDHFSDLTAKTPEGSEERKKLVMISGPEGFIETFGGQKGMRGGKEIQGPLGGILQKINPQGWTVWKL